MGSCISTLKTIKDQQFQANDQESDGQSSNDIASSHSKSLTIIPGDFENIGYLMHEVIVRNNLPQCAYLLQMGFPINTPLKYSSSVPTSSTRVERVLYYEFYGTALHVACIYRRPAIVELLMLHSADPNVIDRFGRTPVILTVTYWPRIAMMNAENKGYAEVVMKTIPKKSYRCLESLCLNGANVNGKFGSQEESPLHLAARYHISSCAHVLLNFGADVNALDNRGMTPLHYACRRLTVRKDDKELLGVLLQHGANVNLQDCEGNTPLHIASQNGCCTFISELISYGANPELKNKRQLSSLYLLMECVHCPTNPQILDAMLNECIYLRIFDANFNLPALLRLPDMCHIRANLLLLATQAPPLTHICRQFIRKTIGLRRLTKNSLSTLPLPVALQNVLLTQTNYVCDIIKLN